MRRSPRPSLRFFLSCPVVLAALLVPAGCDDGDDGPPGPPGASVPPPPISTQRTRDEGLPGMNVEIVEVTGASTGANFQVGDRVSVRFTVELDDGTPVPLDELDFAAILVSGPTFHYQPVLARQSDLASAATANPDGSWTYTFADPIPATYLPPLNDSPAFGPDDGEWQGQPLVDGTYTVGIELYKGYTIEGQSFRDAGNAVGDFLFGAAQNLETRAVVAQENCDQCHNDLRAHGTIRREVRHCLLCHTAGAEDRNVASAAGGTPGVTIDFRVMIHRIHNGAHLPSVLGVATNPDGTRNYAATPQPYQVVGFGNSVHDFSDVEFPVWPNLSEPMPRDGGYSSLSRSEQSLENEIRSGVTACDRCHGDPDGTGPIEAPAQGQLAYAQPTRNVCGSCHDDVEWSQPYISNMLRMPPQQDDALCSQCHPASGSPLAAMEAHLHPLLDPALNPGLTFHVDMVHEGGNANGDGSLDPGETLLVDYRIEDRNGQAVAPSTLDRMEFAIAGPTANRNILNEGRFPPAALAASSGTTALPETVWLEIAGLSTSAPGETFTTSRTPHWNVSGAETTVMTVTGVGAITGLSAAAPAVQNFVDVADPTGFDRGDHVAIFLGSTALAEVLRVQWVDGNRLWFSSVHNTYSQPSLRASHASGDAVLELRTTTLTEGTEYDLDPATGTITELTEFGAGLPVLATYTTDFLVPARYPGAINDSPDLDSDVGEWSALPLLDGTYTVALWGEVPVSVTFAGESTEYSGTSPAGSRDFLVGDATTLQRPGVIASEQSCYACHQDIYFHGGHRRGFETCITCHGTAGAEDRPRYVAPGAPETEGTSIEFRRMLHKIHHGANLANASTYEVNGFGSGYPNNFTAHTYEHVHFPALPGETAECAKCHGANNPAWEVPADREHPMQSVPTRSWAVACGSCHDSSAAQAHIAVQTAATGDESCGVCHGQNDDEGVERMHRTW